MPFYLSFILYLQRDTSNQRSFTMFWCANFYFPLKISFYRVIVFEMRSVYYKAIKLFYSEMYILF
jgi:hypothetical protein